MTKHFHDWRTSHLSEPNGHCVEVGRADDGTVGVRDTKLERSPVLEFSPAEWAALLDELRHGT